MTFLRLATPSQILIFSNFILHNFTLVSKSVFLFYGIYLSPNLMRQVEIVQMNLRQYQIHKVTSCKIPKASPWTSFFQRGFLVGLYSVPLIFKRLNFQMCRLRKELVNELGVPILTSCVYCTSQEIQIALIYQKIKKINNSLHCSLH